MRERDRLAALGEMAAGLAHEIRNPLGAIKGAAQCLDPKRLPGEDGEFLEVIVEEVNRLNGVVTAFLDYARPLKQSFGPTDLNEVVTRTVRLIQNEMPERHRAGGGAGRARCRAWTATPSSSSRCSSTWCRTRCRRWATPAGQHHGAARCGRSASATSAATGDEFVEVHVADTGPGIPPDQQPHIFVPFFTTKQKGTGLGLAICQRIVKNHGGTHLGAEQGGRRHHVHHPPAGAPRGAGGRRAPGGHPRAPHPPLPVPGRPGGAARARARREAARAPDRSSDKRRRAS